MCVCLLSRIFFFFSFPRRRPSELPPLKRHFERRKKRYIYVEIYHRGRISAWVPWLKQKNREGKHNQTRKISELGYYSTRNEKLTLCVENFGRLFNVGGLPPPTENAHPPSFFLFWIWLPNYRWKEQFSFFFLYLSPLLKFLGALSSFRLNKSRLCLWWRHFDTIRRRPPIREGGRPTPVEISNENVVVVSLFFFIHMSAGCFSHVWSLVCNECNS